MHRKTSFVALLIFTVPIGLAAQSSRSKATVKAPSSPAEAHFLLAPDGNEVRFIVREQLAGHELPNDAIGKTSAISGSIVIDSKGVVNRAVSKLSVDLNTLTSDQPRRDRFIKRQTLQTDSFPTAELVVNELRGLPARLPTSGTIAVTVLGDLTIHGITKPSSWEATLTVNGAELTGKASTRVKFGDFGMEQPRVMVVLSVVDDIKLEFDFHFVRQADPVSH